MPHGRWVNDLAAGFFPAVHKDMDGTVILT
jgi:hypothetical protein